MASTARATIGYLCAATVVIAVASAGPAAAAGRPAAAAAAGSAARRAAHPGRPAPSPSGPVPGAGPARPAARPASVNPLGAFGRVLSAAQASAAAQTCARYASAAGWVNSAPTSTLATAAAICVAESGGQPTVYYCNPTGQDGYYPPVNCSGLYDRGLWQLDSQAWTSIPDTCAFAALCNADGAYGISQGGLSFSPWATYTSGVYTRYLSDVQAAVAAMHAGTVPSGVLGVCLSRLKYAAGAPAVAARCGSGARRQQWQLSGQAIRDGNLCLAAGSAAKAASVVLRSCAASPAQQWVPVPGGRLRNSLAGRCLRDPGSSVVAGTPVNVGSCTTARSRIWWLP